MPIAHLSAWTKKARYFRYFTMLFAAFQLSRADAKELLALACIGDYRSHIINPGKQDDVYTHDENISIHINDDQTASVNYKNRGTRVAHVVTTSNEYILTFAGRNSDETPDRSEAIIDRSTGAYSENLTGILDKNTLVNITITAKCVKKEWRPLF